MTDLRIFGWVFVHPITAWRRLSAELVDRADAEARAAGLTVEVGPRGVRRYRDPRMDGLATRRLKAVETDEQRPSELTPHVLNAAAGG